MHNPQSSAGCIVNTSIDTGRVFHHRPRQNNFKTTSADETRLDRNPNGLVHVREFILDALQAVIFTRGNKGVLSVLAVTYLRKFMIAEKFLRGLHKVKQTGDNKWIACCPCHDDNNPSMSIKETPNDSGEMCVLIHCFACGATGVDVAEALGLKASDLFPEKVHNTHVKQQRKHFPAIDVLRCLHRDALTIEIIARQIKPNNPMSEVDIDELQKARERIEVALSYCR